MIVSDPTRRQSPPTMPLIPELMDLGTLLRSRAPLEIPRYQRGYAWEAEEIADFIADVRRLHAAGEGEHFFGTILTVRKHVPGQSKDTVLEIVDGQQRITTVVLALNAILAGFRDLETQCEEAGDSEVAGQARETAEDLHREFLWWKDDICQPPEFKPRLKLSIDDDEYYRGLLGGDKVEESRESHRLLSKASVQLAEQLVAPIVDAEASSLVDKAQELRALRNSLVNRAQVLNLTTANKAIAYRLFAVLNDRGKSLSEADLLRTRTLELLDGSASMLKKADRLWSTIMAHPTGTVLSFLRVLYGSQSGQRPPSKNFFDTLQRHFEIESDNPSPREMIRILRTVEALASSARLYVVLADGEWPFKRSKISDWHRDRLNRLVDVMRHRASLPLLLAAAECLTEKMFTNVLQTLELFVFRYVTVCGGHPSSLADALFSEAKAIRDGGKKYRISSLNLALANLAGDHATDRMFKSGLSDALEYRKKKSAVIRHFLTTIEDFKESRWRKGESPQFDTSYVYDFDELHVEHIYPQRAKSKVRALEPLKHEIGNLTFWHPDDNQAAQNDAFSKKCDLYAASKIRMTRSLAAHDRWRTQEVKGRGKELIASAMKIWSIPRNS